METSNQRQNANEVVEWISRRGRLFNLRDAAKRDIPIGVDDMCAVGFDREYLERCALNQHAAGIEDFHNIAAVEMQSQRHEWVAYQKLSKLIG
jgi:hypothetical protein